MAKEIRAACTVSEKYHLTFFIDPDFVTEFGNIIQMADCYMVYKVGVDDPRRLICRQIQTALKKALAGEWKGVGIMRKSAIAPIDKGEAAFINGTADWISQFLLAHTECELSHHVAILVVAACQCMALPDAKVFYGSERKFHRAFSHMMADIFRLTGEVYLKVDRMSDDGESK